MSTPRLFILSEELEKYFVFTGEKSKNGDSIWKCNLDKCERTMYRGRRISHLKHAHINVFQQIDNKLPPRDVTKKRLSGSIVKCVMCGEDFKTMQEFSKHRSFKANYGSDLGCPMRDEYFNGPFKTWKRWSEMYDERSKRLSTIKEREERLKKMLERFRNQKNSSYADLLSVYIKIHPNCTNPLDGFRRGGLSKNIRKRIHAHRNYEAQFMPLDNDYERGEFIIYQLVTDVPEGMARLIEEKLNSSKGFIF